MTVRDESDGQRADGPDADDLVYKHEIAADTAISGKIHFPGDARIDGRLKGEVRADALLVVGSSGVLHASVSADRLIVLGSIHGGTARCRVAELHRGAKLLADLECERLIVHAGATLEGDCRIGGRYEPVVNAPKVILLERPIQAQR